MEDKQLEEILALLEHSRDQHERVALSIARSLVAGDRNGLRRHPDSPYFEQELARDEPLLAAAEVLAKRYQQAIVLVRNRLGEVGRRGRTVGA
jgi:hypothetical protein